MRLIFAIIAILISLLQISFAEECDYAVEVSLKSPEFTEENFTWRIKAEKIMGKPTNITSNSRIEDSTGIAIKNYNTWASQPISRQKTSNEYSPNLKEGNYTIISEIIVECDDINKTNNLNVKKIKIKSSNHNFANENTSNIEGNMRYENTINLRHEDNNTVPSANTAHGQKEYEYLSSNEKAKSLIIYFLFGTSIILGIILLKKTEINSKTL